MATIAPRVLLDRNLNDILSSLAGVFDGDVESVHRARIATRRLREVLPLAINAPDQRLVDVIRSIGRQLGRVRDLDVMRGLLDDVAERNVTVAGTAASAKRALRDRQQVERRAMVKAIEALDLATLRHDLISRGGAWKRWMNRPATLIRFPEWRSILRDRIAGRALKAADAVRHATAIYLPNRAHRARIAIKKLRYAVEVAQDTGIWRPAHMVNDLRRLQGTLGAIHDAQVLIDALDELFAAAGQRPDVAALKATLDNDIVREHAQYVRRRDRVFAINDACQRAVRAGALRPRRPLVAVSLVAAPLVVLGRRQAS